MKITTEQAAAQIRVTDQTIRNYIDRGLLADEKERYGLDWRYRIDKNDLKAFAEKNQLVLK